MTYSCLSPSRVTMLICGFAIFIGVAGPGAYADASLEKLARQGTSSQSSEDALSKAIKNCNDGQPHISVKGCTMLIASGQLDRINLSTAYLNRAIAHAQLSMLGESKNDLTEAIKLTPDNALLYYNRGNIFFDEQNFEKAIADYDSAIATETVFALAYLNRGLAYAEIGNAKNSKRDFRRALELDPSLSIARELLAGISE